MARTKKQVVQSEQVEPKAKPVEAPPVQEPTTEAQTTVITKDDYNRARSVIKQYRETKKTQPKRKCSEKQLAEGRARNKRFAKKQE